MAVNAVGEEIPTTVLVTSVPVACLWPDAAMYWWQGAWLGNLIWSRAAGPRPSAAGRSEPDGTPL